MNINQFTSHISQAGGFARQNRYMVYIPTTVLAQRSKLIADAQAAGGVDTGDSGTDWIGSDFFDNDPGITGYELTAFCDKSMIPGYQFAIETNRHYGPIFKIPHMPEYQEVSMTFYCGSNMMERYFFDAWMYIVMDPMTNDFNYMSEYTVDIDIAQYKDQATSYDKSHSTPVYGDTFINVIPAAIVDANYITTLVDAYPISINQQELGYDMNDSIQQVQVTFAYKVAVPFSGKGSTVRTSRRGDEEQFQQTITIDSPTKPAANPKP